MKKIRLRLFLALCGLALVILASCSEVGYLGQCATGQIDLLLRRQDIRKILNEPDTPPELREKLTAILAMRRFASEELLLPDNGSYRCYADLERPHAVWNVVATPELSMKPLQWCFPVAGCVSYRGYFNRARAERFAEKLRREGNDVYLYGVAAYSTLGWFDDPVLNTFCTRPDEQVAGLIFHELAHQKLYVKNDSAFNEAFAMAVELEGTVRWLKQNGAPEKIGAFLEDRQRQEAFVALIREKKEELDKVYDSPLDEEEKRREKEQIFFRLRSDYESLRAAWGGKGYFDRWFAEELNNAKLSSVSTYHTYVPAFLTLLARNGGNLANFYRAAQELGRLPPTRRRQRLTELLSESSRVLTAADGKDGAF